MKRIKDTGKGQPRIRQIGSGQPKVDPNTVAKALGAEVVIDHKTMLKTENERLVREWLEKRGHRDPHPALVAFIVSQGVGAIVRFADQERKIGQSLATPTTWMSDRENAKARAFLDEQDRLTYEKQIATCPECKPSGPSRCVKHLDGHPYYGAIGGGATFLFTPTGLGSVVVVRHGNGVEMDVTDYESW